VLKEEAHHWFEMDPDQESPYMLMVAAVLESRRAAVTSHERALMESDPDLRKAL
jgi:predicted NodU family carbamoyl transferase